MEHKKIIKHILFSHQLLKFHNSKIFTIKIKLHINGFHLQHLWWIQSVNTYQIRKAVNFFQETLLWICKRTIPWHQNSQIQNLKKKKKRKKMNLLISKTATFISIIIQMNNHIQKKSKSQKGTIYHIFLISKW